MIQIHNLTANKKINEKFLKKVAQQILKKENIKKFELSIILVYRPKIRALNKKYRKKDKPTDILSFNYHDFWELVICIPQVRENAQNFGLTFEQELTKVLIHGILHLLGYNHEKDGQQAQEMKIKEQNYLLVLQKNKLYF